eukprot:CFRG3917T1
MVWRYEKDMLRTPPLDPEDCPSRNRDKGVVRCRLFDDENSVSMGVKPTPLRLNCSTNYSTGSRNRSDIPTSDLLKRKRDSMESVTESLGRVTTHSWAFQPTQNENSSLRPKAERNEERPVQPLSACHLNHNTQSLNREGLESILKCTKTLKMRRTSSVFEDETPRANIQDLPSALDNDDSNFSTSTTATQICSDSATYIARSSSFGMISNKSFSDSTPVSQVLPFSYLDSPSIMPIPVPTFSHVQATPESRNDYMIMLPEDEALRGDGSICTLPIVRGRNHHINLCPKRAAELLEGKSLESFSSLEIIDARFPYEYKGGHIQGAKNLYTTAMLSEWADAMREKLITSSDPRPICVLFYCEFSQQRGPSLYSHLRGLDRKWNIDSYPKLEFPELYVVHGGYRSFFKHAPSLCEPQNYVRMEDKEHRTELNKHQHIIKRCKTWSVTAGLDMRSKRRSDDKCRPRVLFPVKSAPIGRAPMFANLNSMSEDECQEPNHSTSPSHVYKHNRSLA